MNGNTKLPILFKYDAALSVAIAAALLVMQAVTLHLMGLPTICRCGYVSLWYGNPSGPDTSQHLSDWYTYTHVLHGVAFYGLLSMVAPKLSIPQRLVLALGVEMAWEIFENTPMVIERYRKGALAQGYIGDSVVNSLSDSFAAIVGFILAWRLPLAAILVLAIAVELIAGYFIRDGLLLNIIQLVHPTEALSQWQAGR
jgi:hypothetical protein